MLVPLDAPVLDGLFVLLEPDDEDGLELELLLGLELELLLGVELMLPEDELVPPEALLFPPFWCASHSE